MADQNINNQTVTWNSGGTTFNAIKMNVTDTASAAASLLLLLQVGGTDKFKVGKDGTVTAAGSLAVAGSATITGNLTVSGTLTAAGLSGAVTGAASSTDNAIARWNGAGGGSIQNSGVTIDDSNNLVTAGYVDAASFKVAGVTMTTAVATAAQYRANTASLLLTTDKVWSAAAEVTLTDAATIAVDFSTFINATVTLAGNRAMGNPTNEKVGQSGVIRIVQDGTGSRTLSYGTDWEFAGATAPVLTTTAGANDLLFYYIIAADRVFGNLVKGAA
ncbi:hypothetical protein NKJ71_19395 [Mesorhizobium sp. M0050]|uniref:hypothetical protein n=1 Tax=Mesorhizobium sp. M0050 TaxID=2956861 RepID=UPI00333C33E3